MDQILMGLTKLAPVVAVLIAGIYYFFKKENDYKQEIKELNLIIREQEKQTLEIMSKLTVTLDKIVQNDAINKDSIVSEIKALKDILLTKIESLNK